MGMSAAAVRYVDHMGFDQRCFTAAVIDLGVNGHLKIAGGGDDKPVMKQHDGGKPIPAAEQAMESKLFAAGPSLLLDQVNHERLNKASAALSDGLDKAYLGKLFSNNLGWSVFGGLMALLVVAAIIVSLIATASNDDAVPVRLAAMLIPTIFIIVGAMMIFRGLQFETQSWGFTITGIVMVAIFAVGGLVVTWMNARGWLDLVQPIVIYVVMSFAGIGFRWLQAPSVEGRRVIDQIEGFKQYLGVAEEDRLETLNPPDKTPELFERFLPYAFALDVQNTWAKRFSAVLAAAGTTAAAVTSSWYSGNQSWGNDPVGFADHLSTSLSSTISSASTPPGSSDSGGGGGGSSGGGSSGGGGGGGGGSGW